MDLFRLDPKRERRTRIALFGGLAVAAAGLVLASWWLDRGPRGLGDQAWFDIDFESHPDVALLRDYVRIDTSAESGSELAGAEFLARELGAMGLAPTVERLGEDGANLWAVLEGEDPRALVLHHHIDVSRVDEPESWQHPPFDGVIEKPWIYGRGTFDMKSVAVAQIQALRELAGRDRRPRRSVILLATGSEEIGSELGARWVLARHPGLTSRFWAVLTEGGVVEPTSQQQVKYWGIEFAQRRFAEVELCAAERELLERRRDEILAWAQGAARPALTAEVADFLTAYGGSRTDPEYQRLLAEVRRTVLDPSAFGRLPGYLRSALSSEIVPFEVQPDPGGGFRLRLLFHLLPGADFEETRSRLLPPWLVDDVAAAVHPPAGTAAGSPLDHPAFGALVETVREAYPETPVGPYFLPWSATDSRFFRADGIPAYGFSPFAVYSTDTFRVDGANERIDLPGFLQGVELYRRVLDRLAG